MTTGRRRYLVCVPDGAAEEASARLGGRTPQQAAFMPVLSKLAAQGHESWARTIPAGLAPSSDVGIMAILGYAPVEHRISRAALEAASLDLAIGPEQTVFRANLVTVAEDGTMLDFTGGHPTTAEAGLAMSMLEGRCGDEVSFHPGLGYRNLMTAPLSWGNACCTPPHEVLGRKAPAPRGTSAPMLLRVMTASRGVLAASSLPANQVWLWGQGVPAPLPAFRERYGYRATMVAAVPIARGLARLAGLTVVDVPGATGWHDTDWTAKRDAAIDAYQSGGADLVVIHVAATDEAGHAGDLDAKIEALEMWDRIILRGLTAFLSASGPWRLLWIPDHATSTALRSHTSQPVPFVVADSLGPTPPDLRARRDAPIPAYEIMPRFLSA